MKKPLCELCGERHFLSEGHYFKCVPTWTVSNKKTVSNEVLPKVTESVTEGNAPHCPTCTCFGKKYASNAEKQRAYRSRHRVE